MSGLIATIILFAILFTTGMALITFVTDSQFRLQDAARDALERDIQRMRESLRVETSKLADGHLGVLIFNTGPIPVQVKQILVLDSDGLLIENIDEPTFPITLNAHEVTPATIDTDVAIESGERYTVRVVTERGTIASAPYPPETVSSVVSSEISKAIGSVSMDTTTLQYSQDEGNTWNEGWNIPGGVNTIWRVNVTNMVDRDIYLSKYSSFFFISLADEPGQLAPRVFYITSNRTATTYPDLEVSNFTANGGVILPAGGASTVTIYLKLKDPGSSTFSVKLNPDVQYHTILGLFGKYDSPTSSTYYGQSLPFVGVRTGS